MPEFILAFGVYKHIMCSAHPQRRIELDLYERDIVNMATRYDNGFYEYHRSFSLNAASQLRYNNTPIDWSIRDNNLFCNIFANRTPNVCQHCQSTLHSTDFCPTLTRSTPNFNRPSADGNSKSQAGGFNYGNPHETREMHGDKVICFKYNSLVGCSFLNCFFAHVCTICKQPHPKYNCPLDNARPPNRKR